MEQHDIGVDLHPAFFQACAVRPSGERIREARFPRTTDGPCLFRRRCVEPSRIAVEATGATWSFVGAVRAGLDDAPAKRRYPPVGFAWVLRVTVSPEAGHTVPRLVRPRQAAHAEAVDADGRMTAPRRGIRSPSRWRRSSALGPCGP